MDNSIKKIIYLFVFLLLDFIFTYIGINKFGVIYEANPILVNLFNLSFTMGFIIRFLHGLFISALMLFLYYNYDKFDRFINAVLVIESILMLIHLRWTFLFISPIMKAFIS